MPQKKSNLELKTMTEQSKNDKPRSLERLDVILGSMTGLLVKLPTKTSSIDVSNGPVDLLAAGIISELLKISTTTTSRTKSSLEVYMKQV